MAASEALLSLELNGNELVANMLQVAQAGKGYLLLQIVSEGITTKEIAKDAGDKRAEKQPSVEQGLEGEAVAQRERLPPGGTQVAHTTVDKRTLNDAHLVEVRGDIGIGRLEACTTGREMPVVLGIEIHGSPITEVMFILEIQFIPFFRPQLVAEVVIVPSESYAEIEVPDAEVEGFNGSLVMVVKDGVVTVAFRINVDVVTTEIVREGRTRESEAVRVVHDLTASQHPLTQTERDVGAEV